MQNAYLLVQAKKKFRQGCDSIPEIASRGKISFGCIYSRHLREGFVIMKRLTVRKTTKRLLLCAIFGGVGMPWLTSVGMPAEGQTPRKAKKQTAKPTKKPAPKSSTTNVKPPPKSVAPPRLL